MKMTVPSDLSFRSDVAYEDLFQTGLIYSAIHILIHLAVLTKHTCMTGQTDWQNCQEIYRNFRIAVYYQPGWLYGNGPRNAWLNVRRSVWQYSDKLNDCCMGLCGWLARLQLPAICAKRPKSRNSGNNSALTGHVGLQRVRQHAE